MIGEKENWDDKTEGRIGRERWKEGKEEAGRGEELAFGHLSLNSWLCSCHKQVIAMNADA